MKSHHRALLLALSGALAVATVAVASASPAASKQRIAIDAKSSTVYGKTTFVLSALSGGQLEGDVGSGENTGSPKPSVVKKNGQSMNRVAFTDSLVGKNGSFKLLGNVESFSAGSGYLANHGTWTFKGLAGAYAGHTGGGGVALVVTPTGKLIYRLEGYVSQR